jgi:predicted DNA-binding helix-hairpin-helix protein
MLSAKRLVDLRRQKRIRFEDLTRLRCSLEKAKPFVITQDYRPSLAGRESAMLRQHLRDTPAQLALW